MRTPGRFFLEITARVNIAKMPPERAREANSRTTGNVLSQLNNNYFFKNQTSVVFVSPFNVKYIVKLNTFLCKVNNLNSNIQPHALSLNTWLSELNGVPGDQLTAWRVSSHGVNKKKKTRRKKKWTLRGAGVRHALPLTHTPIHRDTLRTHCGESF